MNNIILNHKKYHILLYHEDKEYVESVKSVKSVSNGEVILEIAVSDADFREKMTHPLLCAFVSEKHADVMEGNDREFHCSYVIKEEKEQEFNSRPYILQSAGPEAVEKTVERVKLSAAGGRGLRDKITQSGLLGESDVFLRSLENIDDYAASDYPVLISGETGTGKEMIAKLVHNLSARRNRRYLAVNCGAIPPELSESELFGHAKGAYTGSVGERKGLIMEVSGGSLFLDEITESTGRLQSDLLRAVEYGEVTAVGSEKTEKVNVRFIVATNRDIEGEVEARRFRRDLYYRLNVVRISLPPLRERTGDLRILAESFVRKYARTHIDRHLRPVSGIDPGAIDRLGEHDWPGNIRELENTIRRAMLNAKGDTITRTDIAKHLAAGSRRDGAQDGCSRWPDRLPLNITLLKEEALKEAFNRTGGKVSPMARLLGVNPDTVRKWLRKKEKTGDARDIR
ncbi:MAG: sigma-54 dependent transcriptional regulator [Deltaproteobacteria bacterium]|jgi:transcriptional regulator with PAS, ATPase and Fis domain|nr:sigma-54 dependent transcriptional regulator [Deltaproteobacteria bacterium]